MTDSTEQKYSPHVILSAGLIVMFGLPCVTMLALGILHSHYHVVPAFSYLETLVVSTALRWTVRTMRD